MNLESFFENKESILVFMEFWINIEKLIIWVKSGLLDHYLETMFVLWVKGWSGIDNF